MICHVVRSQAQWARQRSACRDPPQIVLPQSHSAHRTEANCSNSHHLWRARSEKMERLIFMTRSVWENRKRSKPNADGINADVSAVRRTNCARDRHCKVHLAEKAHVAQGPSKNVCACEVPSCHRGKILDTNIVPYLMKKNNKQIHKRIPYAHNTLSHALENPIGTCTLCAAARSQLKKTSAFGR